MKKFNHVHELLSDMSVPDSVKNDLLSILNDSITEGCEYNDTEDDFNGYFGGEVYYLETAEDLKAICTTKSVEDGSRWKNITETADAFDGARYVDEDIISLFLAWNNAGGPSFYIPRHVYAQCPNVEQSVSLTDTLWSNSNEDSAS